MSSARLFSSGLSFFGALFQLGLIWGMDPLDWRTCRIAWCADVAQAPDLRVFTPWAPHLETAGEGRPGFPWHRCPGRQAAGMPFRIVDAPLPAGYDPHAFPDLDVVACVRLDSSGAVLEAWLVSGTGRAALDRNLLRTLYRQWRFEPSDDAAAAPGWQRVRLNSAYGAKPLPEWEISVLPL
jgi:hypothetical protein